MCGSNASGKSKKCVKFATLLPCFAQGLSPPRIQGFSEKVNKLKEMICGGGRMWSRLEEVASLHGASALYLIKIVNYLVIHRSQPTIPFEDCEPANSILPAE